MTRVLALCADDYGISPGISAGILGLARAERLSAVSCITNSTHWPELAPRLSDLPKSVDIGLHLNLTEGVPLSQRLARRWPTLPSLATLISRAHLGLLPLAELRGEVHAQLRAFLHGHGVAPAYIDGHQHVHHLPGLRDTILDVTEHVQPLPAVRSTARLIGPGYGFKRWVIEATGGRRLERALTERVMAFNPALLGVYDFKQADYGALMRAWLNALPPEGGLLFCHPGTRLADDPPDAIADARTRELAYLSSADFKADLRDADVVLGRVWRTVDARVNPRTSSDD